VSSGLGVLYNVWFAPISVVALAQICYSKGGEVDV
jgi:hypothetical protein